MSLPNVELESVHLAVLWLMWLMWLLLLLLMQIGSMAETSVYSLTALFLITGLISQVLLLQLTVESPENGTHRIRALVRVARSGIV